MDKYVKEVNVEIQVAEAAARRIDERLSYVYDMLFKIKHIAEDILEKDIDAYLRRIPKFDPEQYAGFNTISDEEADMRYELYDDLEDAVGEIESREQEVKEIFDIVSHLVWGVEE